MRRKSLLLRRTFWRGMALTLLVAIPSGLLGEFYSNTFYTREQFDWYLGFRIGFSIAFISALIEIFYIRSIRRSWIRRVAFLPGLLVRILVLTVLVRVCLLGNIYLTSLWGGFSFFDGLNAANQVRDTLFSMGFVIGFVILSQLTTVIGLRRFGSLVVGRYFKPVSEERVFLFVDLVGSTQLALRLGNVRFHEFLSEFFFQIDRSIVRTGGEIVAYVGDAVIVTWPLRIHSKRNVDSLLTLRSMLRRMEEIGKIFEGQFGERPVFRAAIHCGEVVVGECGNSRRQVTFLGDVVNTTARIEDYTKSHNEEFVASKAFTSLVVFPKGIRAEPLGKVELKGLSEEIELCRITFDPVS